MWDINDEFLIDSDKNPSKSNVFTAEIQVSTLSKSVQSSNYWREYLSEIRSYIRFIKLLAQAQYCYKVPREIQSKVGHGAASMYYSR